MQEQSLQGGFSSEPIEAAQAFRAAMSAMARPGRIEVMAGARPPAPMSVAAGALILTLCDPETPVYLAGAWACAEVRDWITFHCGAPFADRATCTFALGDWASLSPLSAYPIGTPEYPDRSATLIVEVPVLAEQGATLRGPGIRDTATLLLPEVAAFQSNSALFPLGLDFFLTSGECLAAVPRTIQVSQSEG